MKIRNTMKHLFAPIALLATLSVLLGGCTQTCTEEVVIIEDVVYASHAELQSQIAVGEAEPLREPGKIYYKDDYIFINERNEGVHIIDLRDANNPVNLKYISIPGCVDVAVQGNALYADSYSDLQVFDISNLNSIQHVQTVENVFPDSAELIGLDRDPSKVVVGLKRGVREMKVGCDGGNMGFGAMAEDDVMIDPTSNGSGTAGSYARFSLVDNHLYTISLGQMQAFDVTNALAPQKRSNTDIVDDAETVYAYEGNMFVGSTTGLEIYDVTSNPGYPAQLSSVRHLNSSNCPKDPVVVQGNYAYSTLWTNSPCGSWDNVLEIFDISDLSNPRSVNQLPMTQPRGLAIGGDYLYIAQDNAGWEVYKLVTPTQPELVTTISDIRALDMAHLGDRLLVVGDDGFYMYDITNPESPVQMSQIPIILQ